MTIPKCVFLIGAPASGKTTFAAKHLGDFFTVGTDPYIHAMMKEYGTDYKTTFRHHIMDACKMMITDMREATERKKDIVIDLTNWTKESRWRKLRFVPKFYELSAVHFSVTDAEQKKRIKARGKGYEIPGEVLRTFAWQHFEPASGFEGFRHIVRAENWPSVNSYRASQW